MANIFHTVVINFLNPYEDITGNYKHPYEQDYIKRQNVEIWERAKREYGVVGDPPKHLLPEDYNGK